MAFCACLGGALLFQSPSALVLLQSGSANQKARFYPLCTKEKLGLLNKGVFSNSNKLEKITIFFQKSNPNTIRSTMMSTSRNL